MVNKIDLSKKKLKFGVHEHLRHWVTKTTYAQRLQWLQDAKDFVNLLKRRRGYPNLSRSQKKVV